MTGTIIPITIVCITIVNIVYRLTTWFLVVAGRVPPITAEFITIGFIIQVLTGRGSTRTSIIIPITSRSSLTGGLVGYVLALERVAVATSVIPVITISFAIVFVVGLRAGRRIGMTVIIPPITSVSFTSIPVIPAPTLPLSIHALE